MANGIALSSPTKYSSISNKKVSADGDMFTILDELEIRRIMMTSGYSLEQATSVYFQQLQEKKHSVRKNTIIRFVIAVLAHQLSLFIATECSQQQIYACMG